MWNDKEFGKVEKNKRARLEDIKALGGIEEQIAF